VNQVNADICEAGTARGLESLPGLICGMDSSETYEKTIVKRLNPQRDPVDAGVAERLQREFINSARVCFQGNFCFFPDR
jgi:hypothetical protein